MKILKNYTHIHTRQNKMKIDIHNNINMNLYDKVVNRVYSPIIIILMKFSNATI